MSFGVGPDDMPQGLHLQPEVRAAVAHHQMHAQRGPFAQTQRQFHLARAELGDFLAAQHVPAPGRPQPDSMQPLSLSRARCRMTWQLLVEIFNWSQISSESKPRNSRIMNTLPVLAGRWSRQASNTAQNCRESMDSSGSGQAVGLGPSRQRPFSLNSVSMRSFQSSPSSSRSDTGTLRFAVRRWSMMRLRRMANTQVFSVD